MEKRPYFFQKFYEYPSIEPSKSKKLQKRISNSKANSPDVLWVATEKIHGSNFSIAYDLTNDLVRYARRNDFISEQIPVPTQDVAPYFKQNFLDAPQLVNRFHNSLAKVKLNVLKKYPNILGFQIYGQYFGGYWPGKVECKRRVQLGVYYTPNHEFMAFDFRLFGHNFDTWVEIIEISQIVQNHLKFVPIYAKGSFQQIQKIASEFDSTIPELLGLQRLNNNICEGLILRPNKNLDKMNRIVIKKKNQEFLERVFGKGNQPDKKIEKEEKNQSLELLKRYFNENRIQSAISKYPDFKDHYHLKGQIIEDVLKDIQKENDDIASNLTKLKKVLEMFDKFVYQKVIEYLQTVRTEFKDRIKK